jgi:hypothetical protein
MSKSLRFGRWTRTALLALVTGTALLSALYSLKALNSGQADELAADVDGDGRLDRVRWRRYGDDYWLDVALAQADGSFALRSSTRVAAAGAGERWSWRARDVDGDGRTDILVGDGRGHAQVWISDGRGFSEAPPRVSTWAALANGRRL